MCVCVCVVGRITVYLGVPFFFFFFVARFVFVLSVAWSPRKWDLFPAVAYLFEHCFFFFQVHVFFSSSFVLLLNVDKRRTRCTTKKKKRKINSLSQVTLIYAYAYIYICSLEDVLIRNQTKNTNSTGIVDK